MSEFLYGLGTGIACSAFVFLILKFFKNRQFWNFIHLKSEIEKIKLDLVEIWKKIPK